MSSSSSSRRSPRHLSLFYQNSSSSQKNHKQIVNNIDISKYSQTINNYKQFLEMFQKNIQKVCQKQNYRIYLNDRKNQKTFNSLIEQKNNLLHAIQQSKDYRQSANRQLIEQVMSLQKQRQQYMDRNDDILRNIKNKKQQISKKRLELKQLQREIKSYWIYSYDLTGGSVNDSVISGGSSGSNCGGGNINSARRRDSGKSSNGCDDKENNVVTNGDSNNNNHNISINITSPLINNNNSHIHLPYISPKSHNMSMSSSSIINQSQSITVFSKQLSLINSSPTRQKVINKINLSYQQQAQNKLEYQREKLSLLKMFCVYLKKMEQQQNGITDRLRLEKVANQLLQKITLKENKLNQIEKLINSTK